MLVYNRYKNKMGIVIIPVKACKGEILQDNLNNLGGNTRERLEYLEWRLFWEGRFNRADLMKQFDVSKPQVSVDLRKYKEIAESNLIYNPTKKHFTASSRMKPKILKVSSTRLLLQLRALSENVISRKAVWFKTLPDFDVLPDLRSEVRASVLRRVLRAIRKERSINIMYRSLNGSEAREVAPHALGFDGQRWHARAWCHKNADFRDFVLTRIEKASKTKACEIDPTTDSDWTEKIDLVLHANPQLSAEQRETIQKDYGMRDGKRTLTIRRALAFYLIQNLDLDVDGLPPKRSHLRLYNREDVFKQINWQSTEVKICS